MSAPCHLSLPVTYSYGSDLISQANYAPGPLLPAVSYYGYDGLGSVRQLTNTSGAVTDTWDYDAFGNVISRTGTTDNLYLYRGEQFDADLGMYSLRARFYNQNTGRFWNADTYEGSVGDPASLHRYLYANANPVMGFDPSGHFTLVELQDALVAISHMARMALPTIRSVYTAAYVVGTQMAYSTTFWAVSFSVLSGASVLADGGSIEDAFVVSLLGYISPVGR